MEAYILSWKLLNDCELGQHAVYIEECCMDVGEYLRTADSSGFRGTFSVCLKR
jgi:hypothetical protein